MQIIRGQRGKKGPGDLGLNLGVAVSQDSVPQPARALLELDRIPH